MIQDIKRLFRKLTPAEMAAKELGDAELAVLEARTAHEYAQSMISYHEARIKRLRAFLANLEQPRVATAVLVPNVAEFFNKEF